MGRVEQAFSIRLKHCMAIVDAIKEEKGFVSYAKTVRFIIEDYNRISKKLDAARNADFDKLCDMISGKHPLPINSGDGEQLTAIKSDIDQLKQMVVVLSLFDEEVTQKFAEYWPEYFK